MLIVVLIASDSNGRADSLLTVLPWCNHILLLNHCIWRLDDFLGDVRVALDSLIVIDNCVWVMLSDSLHLGSST